MADEKEKWAECGQDELEEIDGKEESKEKETRGEQEGKVETKKPASELEKLMQENTNLINDLKRLAAEFENYQKRTEREKNESSGAGKGAVLKKLITLADEFEAAEAHMQRESESELRNGVRLLHKKLMTLLEEEGVEQMEYLGKRFDPDRCDAVELVDNEGEEGIVAKEMRKGYVYNGKVLRHAMVGVTKKPNNKEEKKE